MIDSEEMINMALQQVPLELRPQVRTIVTKQTASLDKTSAPGEAGAGMVKVTVNTMNKLKTIKIEPKLLVDADENAQFIEDLIMAAYTNACEQAEKEFQRIQGETMDQMNKLMREHQLKQIDKQNSTANG